ncbi:TlpA disulfide reductase family protein [Micromonospora sp. NPDC049559]|uniref:TlpA family protein disulfide reductase n=1 Tax=Micromonospora sp. NPDC049559 TaxID=3155923 RepID=UPI0034130FA9
MVRPPRIVLAALLAVVAAVALAGCSGGGWQEKCDSSADGIITCAPGDRPGPVKVSGELLDGGTYDLSADLGQVVVVNFWGSWCAPCVAEADDLEGTYQATKASGVRFLGVNVQDQRDKARAFEQGRVSYPSLFDPASRQALAFEIPPNSTPATVVLDRQGRIAVVIRKAVRRDDLEPIVARVAAERPADGAR